MICTFYSYKGGVGRSMALANVAAAMARDGMRVLMVDFDLEAPGLEQFFPIDYRQLRQHEGLLDLLLRYKQAMARGPEPGDEPASFRRLSELFIVPIYDQLPSGGRLDLLPAGQRGDDEQLARYAHNLRTFDWQDFYFNWAGELFFEWLRTTLVPGLYDAVLVDSRTGVTEMGGICAYQLADTIVMLCASNYQNIDGTHNVVRNFLSPRVRALRRNRPLEVLIVPARIEQHDDKLLHEFRERFEQTFDAYTPPALHSAGRSFWSLLIPYEPRYAFEEQVVERGRHVDGKAEVASALRRLVEALALLAEPEAPLGRLAPVPAADRPRPAAPQYDVTSRTAGYDVFVSCRPEDRGAAEQIAGKLRESGLSVVLADQQGRPAAEPAVEDALRLSRTCLVLFGDDGASSLQNETVRAAIEGSADRLTIVPVLLPGGDRPSEQRLPALVRSLQWADLRGGLDDAEGFAKLLRAVRGSMPHAELAATTVELGTPFRGLLPFGEDDASFFFGREALVEELLSRVKHSSLLAVVGPSGSGKSSVVRAGLIPALRRGEIPGSERWICVAMRPGERPLEALAAAVAPLGGTGEVEITALARRLAEDPQALRSTAERALEKQSGARLVLLVDQLEEVWTLTRDQAKREAFVRLLLEAAEPGGPVVVLLTLRADFVGEALAYRDLAAALTRSLVLVGPMSREELRRAIVGPAKAVGLALEPGLVELILEDMAGEPGALPLLQSLLFELYRRRGSGYLKLTSYEAIGGVQGVLAFTGDSAFQALTPEEQAIARRVLLRLVQPGEGAADSRRRATIDELLPSGDVPARVEQVVQRLTAERLLVTGRDQGGAVTVELAHEALIHGWPLLRRWVAEEREALHALRQLGDAALDWERSGRDRSYLFRGARLASATERFAGGSDLNRLERAFLAESARVERTRSRVRRGSLIAGFIVAATMVSCVVLFALLYVQLDRSVQSTQATSAAVAATALSQSNATATAEAAARSLAERANTTAYSPDRSLVASFDAENFFTVRRNGSADVLFRIDSSGRRGTTTAFSPDGRLVAVGFDDGTIELRDSLSGDLRAALTGHTGAVQRISFGPDGRILASAGDTTGRLWDVPSESQLAVLDHAEPVVSIDFTPDGRLVSTVTADGTIRTWTPAGQLVETKLASPTPTAPARRPTAPPVSP